MPRDEDSQLSQLLRVWARSLNRFEATTDFLRRDFDPRETTSFLEDYERLLGLPDCGDLPESTAERRAAVLEKFTRVGSLAKQDLIDAAAILGFTITIDDQLAAPDEHYFDVVLLSLEVQWFRVGESRAGDSLGSFGDTQLRCLLDTRKPAHLNYRLTVPT